MVKCPKEKFFSTVEEIHHSNGWYTGVVESEEVGCRERVGEREGGGEEEKGREG